MRVARIDLTYEYAAGVGLEPHTEEDGGDIYAPAGTKVAAHDHHRQAGGARRSCDWPMARRRAARAQPGVDAPISSCRRTARTASRSNDVDGLSNAGDTEYFIRMLNDRPPDVRILRPAGDKQVSPLEEVEIEARADDDYGVRSLELVIKSAAGKEKVVPDSARRSADSVGDRHRTRVFLEDLDVKPGDFVTYHARATRCRPRPALDRIAQRHLLPRGEAVRRGVRRRRKPGRRHVGPAGDRARGADRAAERHHGRDVEARCARAARRRRRAVASRTSARSRRRNRR